MADTGTSGKRDPKIRISFDLAQAIDTAIRTWAKENKLSYSRAVREILRAQAGRLQELNLAVAHAASVSGTTSSHAVMVEPGLKAFVDNQSGNLSFTKSGFVGSLLAEAVQADRLSALKPGGDEDDWDGPKYTS